MVAKQNGENRCYGDYRSLSSTIKNDRNINSFSTKLANKQRFSKIDLILAKHQIKKHPDDLTKTALTTPFGQYEFI